MPTSLTSPGTGAPNPVSGDSPPVDADLADHVHQVQDWLNGGALIWIRHGQADHRANMLDELAAVLCAAAVAAAHEAASVRAAKTQCKPLDNVHQLAIYPPEQSKDSHYIVWAVSADSLVAHAVLQPAAGRMVDPACGPVFFASSMFGRKPDCLTICGVCDKAMFGGDR